MRNISSDRYGNETLFVKRHQTEQKSSRSYGMLNIVLLIYGIGNSHDVSTIYKTLYKFHALFMHLMPVYITSRYILLCFYSPIELELVFGCIVSCVFPFALHYSLISKRHDLKWLLKHYCRLDFFQRKTSKSCKTMKINVAIATILIVPMVLSIVSTLSMMPDKAYSRSYTYFIDIRDVTLEMSLRFVAVHMICAYLYTFPCIIAVMCAVIYHEFSQFLDRFHESLQRHCSSLSRNKILQHMKMHTALFKLAHHVQDTLSTPCFFLLCTQLTVMFYTIAVFVLRNYQTIPVALICRALMILLMTPASVIAVVLYATRINAFCKKIETEIKLLNDKLIVQGYCDGDTLCYLNSMNEKQFPVMSACGVTELKPNITLRMFGSLFSYSLLILNLKN
ncbi:hypothetical protein AVEN_112295-1 [Araneus ventricosus]|uniref:Gustatory receptor n=1 Tax=Araneus ventricosus TaxID=182803 RepID=A0A4Y2N429_ARAVE|nr:hypothetical protein AVEN_112295-1 [Araneus ventricosus]